MYHYNHPNAPKVHYYLEEATVLKLKWMTKDEKIDCGLYMLLHMELYKGQRTSKWITGLYPENHINHREQMDNLRARIATKISLHDINNLKNKMSKYARKMTEE